MILLQQKEGSRPPRDSFKLQEEAWRRAYAEATIMQERFRAVEQLVLDIAFTDLGRIGTYSPQMHSFSPSAKAFFAVACPRTLCLHGGFDLDSAVSAMLSAGATASSGTVECRGWVDPTCPDHARCRLQMYFRLQARYKAAEANVLSRRSSRASKL
jgi:hypothetical protein